MKDLDEVTTKEEVAKALSAALGKEVLDGAVKGIRPAYGGTRTAIVKLPVESAKAAVELGSIRIGWVLGCVRIGTGSTKKCLKCWATGHLAAACRQAWIEPKIVLSAG